MSVAKSVAMEEKSIAKSSIVSIGDLNTFTLLWTAIYAIEPPLSAMGAKD